MDSKLLSCVGNPVRLKLFQEIYLNRRMTTGQLQQKFGGIPQATLYRHLKKMLADGAIKVAEENRIRGAVERVYAPGFDYGESLGGIVAENDGQALFQIASGHMLGLIREFQEYAEKEDIDLRADGSLVTAVSVYATADELKEALEAVAAAVAPLAANGPDGKRKLRSISLIVTPPRQE